MRTLLHGLVLTYLALVASGKQIVEKRYDGKCFYDDCLLFFDIVSNVQRLQFGVLFVPDPDVKIVQTLWWRRILSQTMREGMLLTAPALLAMNRTVILYVWVCISPIMS